MSLAKVLDSFKAFLEVLNLWHQLLSFWPVIWAWHHPECLLTSTLNSCNRVLLCCICSFHTAVQQSMLESFVHLLWG